ncbi:hypothetical protein D3C87_123620 [compost metagenome]
MKKFILILTALTLSTPAFAQKIKVRKVKGNQAVIEFSGAPLRLGNVYEISSEDAFGDMSTSSNGGSRAHLLGLSFSLQNGKSDFSGAKNTTNIDLSARYGWNMGSYEFGPILSYTSSNAVTGNTASLIKGGAFADYNLIPNAAGEVFLYGLGGFAEFGSNDSGGGSTTSVMNLAVGPFVKWFAVSSSFALRFDGLFEYAKYSGNAGDTTYSGILLRAGIANYF